MRANQVRPLPTNANGTPLTGRFRIAAVSELTGVPEPTLRAWERRYGVPRPERTNSGYRYYGPLEVQQIRDMHRLCASGVAAAEAARVVKAAKAPAISEFGIYDQTAYATAAAAIVNAVERFDIDALDEHLRAAMFLGSTTAILDDVLVPAMRALGDKWHAGQISVAQEHAASQRVGQSMRDLVRLATPRDHHGTVILACFAHDDHELGVLTTAARVSTWGLRAVVLGARTPPGAIRDAVEALHPVLVGLSVTVAPPNPSARELVDDYASACGRVPWMVGGAGVRAIAERVQARGGLVAPDDHASLETIVRRAVSSQAGADSTKKKKKP